MCDFALGSDTGGSVRIPASFCGLYGIRPTHGRVDLTHGRAMAPSYDTAGWFTNEAVLFKTVGSVVLDDQSVTADMTRLLIAEDCFAQAEPAVADALRAALDAAADVLPTTEPVTVAPGGLESWSEAFRVIQASEVKITNLPWVEEHQANLGAGIRERFDMVAAITEEETAAALPVRESARARLNELVPPGTILCLPTAPVIAPKLDTPPDGLQFFRANTLPLTCISGHSGLPQVTVPAAKCRRLSGRTVVYRLGRRRRSATRLDGKTRTVLYPADVAHSAHILAIDQGTTSTRAIVFDGAGSPVATAQRELPQIYPQAGWVEHDPEEIWQATLAVCCQVLEICAAEAHEIAAIGITNQRETTVLWDRETGKAGPQRHRLAGSPHC